MSLGNDRALSVEKLGIAVSNLVDLATDREDVCEKLLAELRTALNDFKRGAAGLTRDMPNKIAQQTAQEVVRAIADLVVRKVADVLRPAEVEGQTLLREMKEAAAAYRYAAAKCIIVACISGSLCAALVAVFAMKMAGLV